MFFQFIAHCVDPFCLFMRTDRQRRGKFIKLSVFRRFCRLFQPQPETYVTPRSVFRLGFQSFHSVKKTFRIVRSLDKPDSILRISSPVELFDHLKLRLKTPAVFLRIGNVRIIKIDRHPVPLRQPFDHRRAARSAAAVKQHIRSSLFLSFRFHFFFLCISHLHMISHPVFCHTFLFTSGCVLHLPPSPRKSVGIPFFLFSIRFVFMYNQNGKLPEKEPYQYNTKALFVK